MNTRDQYQKRPLRSIHRYNCVIEVPLVYELHNQYFGNDVEEAKKRANEDIQLGGFSVRPEVIDKPKRIGSRRLLDCNIDPDFYNLTDAEYELNVERLGYSENEWYNDDNWRPDDLLPEDSQAL